MNKEMHVICTQSHKICKYILRNPHDRASISHNRCTYLTRLLHVCRMIVVWIWHEFANLDKHSSGEILVRLKFDPGLNRSPHWLAFYKFRTSQQLRSLGPMNTSPVQAMLKLENWNPVIISVGFVSWESF